MSGNLYGAVSILAVHKLSCKACGGLDFKAIPTHCDEAQRLRQALQRRETARDWCPRCGASETWRHSLQIQYDCGSALVEGVFQQTEECRTAKAWGDYLFGR